MPGRRRDDAGPFDPRRLGDPAAGEPPPSPVRIDSTDHQAPRRSGERPCGADDVESALVRVARVHQGVDVGVRRARDAVDRHSHRHHRRAVQVERRRRLLAEREQDPGASERAGLDRALPGAGPARAVEGSGGIEADRVRHRRVHEEARRDRRDDHRPRLRQSPRAVAGGERLDQVRQRGVPAKRAGRPDRDAHHRARRARLAHQRGERLVVPPPAQCRAAGQQCDVDLAHEPQYGAP